MASTKRTIASFFTPVPKRSKQTAVSSAAALPRAGGESGGETEQRPETHDFGQTLPSVMAVPSKVTPAQAMRANANRNMALVKMYVKNTATKGEKLEVKNLLVEQSWKDHLEPEFDKPYFKQLESFLQQEWAGREAVFPPQPMVFRAFNAIPFESVKVVILGQDPYHGPNQAMGLCFSVPQSEKRPSSLLNIYKELHQDCGCNIVPHGNLEPWASQGIFMLNTVLTVRAHQANSHAKKGWEVYTDTAIQLISRKREGVVFLLWGKQAQDKERLIDTKKHHVLKSAHPSGLSAHRGFFGCKHFSKTNEILSSQGLKPIDWQL